MPVDPANPEHRNTELAFLHPTVRAKVQAVLAALAAEDIPLFIYEAYRTPDRQQFLFAQGRDRPGDIITKAKPWESYHQYGLAVDLVFHGPGKWSWKEPGPGMWERMHAIARRHGLEPLSFEKPHIQLAGTSKDALQAGRYPPDGDASWSQNLTTVIAAWNGETAVAATSGVAERPGLAQV